MQTNKNQFFDVRLKSTQKSIEYNIFRNDRPQRWRKRPNEHSIDIITHKFQRNHSTIIPNPEKQITHLSYSKTVPLNEEVIR